MNVEHARSNFPVLSTGFIFADNAGGSQAAKGVVDRISDYLLNTNVQLGADYAYGVQSSTRVFVDGPREAAKLFNAHSPDEIVFGASSTLNFDNLSRGLEKDIQPGDEFIITGEHEANAGPWKKLAARKGAIIKIWSPSPTVPENPYSVKLKLEELLPLVSSRTRIVAITACSNILGSIVPVKEVVKAVRAEAKAQGAPKVEISVDCVAYAPHRLIDVQDWDVDFAAFSFYKVYGPHISGMYVRSTALEHSVSPIVHHFLKVDKVAYKLQPGGPGYEAVYGTTGVVPYLLSLTPQNDLKASFDAIAQHEQTLLQPLIDFLIAPAQRERGVRIVGEETVNLDRVPTVSFVVVGQKPLKSRAIVEYFDAKGGVGIRYGHFYAYTMVDQLSPKIDIDEGVVRISLVHYNTVKEVEKIIEILKEVFAQDDLSLAPKERTTSGY
ncbi:pyridoxal phosphate-dependent transferase [Pholiota molesta]|nr:pyridoxal phosphate-dependent transferase [Pholiota molesta]